MKYENLTNKQLLQLDSETRLEEVLQSRLADLIDAIDDFAADYATQSTRDDDNKNSA